MLKIVNEEGYYRELYVAGTESMTDDEFFVFCEKNRRIRIERDTNNQIYILPQLGLEISRLNCEFSSTVGNWNRVSKTGKVFGSDAGYYLPDTSMRSPDVSWMSNEKWASLSAKEKRQFPRTAPEFIIELVPPFEKLKDIQNKMTKWIENGVLLGWLINPKTETTTIYRADGTVENVIGFDKKLSGEDVLPGLEIDLAILK